MNVICIFYRRACLVTAMAILVGQAISVRAQTVLVDFGSDTSYRGLSVHGADSNGNYWNSLQPGVLVSNLVDIQNTPTTIQVGWDTPVGTDSYNGPAGPTQPSPPAFPHYYDFLPLTDIDANALGNMGGALEGAFDFAAGPGIPGFNQVRFQIQQLDPTKKYDLSFFGSHKYSTDPNTVYTVYSDNTYSTAVGTTNLNVVDPTDPSAHNRDTIATISNLSPQTNNILYVQFIGSAGHEGYLNELRIVASAAPGLTGDYNANGKVDAGDYVEWRKYVGTTHVLSNDPTGGTIGATQYNTWRANYGNGGPGAGSGLGSGGAVPEPASLCLAFIGAIGLILRRRR
jgi:hypothetical protein